MTAIRNTMYTQDFAKGIGMWYENNYSKGCATIDSDVLSLTVRKNDAEGRVRAELAIDARKAPEKGWYGYEVFFPKETVSERYIVCFTQFQTKMDDGTYPHPSVFIGLLNGNIIMDVMDTRYNLGVAPVDKWASVVINYEAGIGDKGLIQVYMNHVLLKEVKGTNRYDSKLHPYFKFGIYEWDVNKSVLAERSVKYRNVSVGGKAYEDVYPYELDRIDTTRKFKDKTQFFSTVRF